MIFDQLKNLTIFFQYDLLQVKKKLTFFLLPNLIFDIFNQLRKKKFRGAEHELVAKIIHASFYNYDCQK